jgi:hypothetical protein
MSDLPPWLDDNDSDENAAGETDWGSGMPPQEEGEGEFAQWLHETGRLRSPDQATPEPGTGLPDWLSSSPESSFESGDLSAEPEPEFEEESPAWLAGDSAEPESESVGSYEEWARQNQMDEIDFEEPVEPFGGQIHDSGITYDEWEQQQIEAETPPEPDVPLPDMPDLFATVDQTGGLGPAVGGEYVPDWYMGVEELDAAEAPDWLKGSGIIGAGTGTSPIATPPPPPAIEPLLPSSDDLTGIDEMPLPTLDEFELSPDLMEEPATADLGAMFLEEELAEPPAEPATADLGALFLEEEELPTEPATADLGTLFLEEEAVVPQGEPSADAFEDLFGADLGMLEPEAEMPSLSEEAAEPGWLADYDRQTAAEEIVSPAAEPAQPSPEVEAAEFPGWFSETDFIGVPMPEEAEEPFQPSVAETSVPGQAIATEEPFDLDSLFGGDIILPSVVETPEEIPDEPGFDDDFLSGIDVVPEETVSAPPAPVEKAPLEPAALEQDELPEWMRLVGATGDHVVLQSGGIEGHFEQIPAVVLPPELRELHENAQRYLAEQQRRSKKPVESGPLAGVEGGLEFDPQSLLPGVLSVDRTYEPTDEQQQRLFALQRVLNLVQAETEAQRIDISYELSATEDEEQVEVELKETPPVRRQIRRKPDRLIVSLVLLLVILLPFATDVLHVAVDPPSELDADAVPIAAAVDELEGTQTRRPVLFAFEYGPTASQELDPLAEAVLRDVLAHNGLPVVISTNPMGLLHARQVLLDLGKDQVLLAVMNRLTPPEPVTPAEEALGFGNARLGFNIDALKDIQSLVEAWQPEPYTPRLHSPQDYMVLPYLAGGAVGVRALVESESTRATLFARDIDGEETGLDIGNTWDKDDFAFVVVIGEHYDDARIWAEQLHDLETPKFALITAAAEPITRPYVNAENYDGILSGIRGSLMYDQVRNSDLKASFDDQDTGLPDPAISRWHAAAWGALVAAVLIVLGTLLNLIRAIRRSRRSAR